MNGTKRIGGVFVLAVALACGGDDDGGADAGRDAATADAATSTDGGRGEDAAVDGSARDAAAGEDADIADAPGPDEGVIDGGSDAGNQDAGDAGPRCEGNTFGTCEEEECLSCPAGGPLNNHLCTRACRSDDDCTHPDRPVCNQPPMGGREGICAPRDFVCRWGAICASPDTPVETPSGPRAIADLVVGDLVYTIDAGERVARPVVEAARVRVHDHRVHRLTLANGAAVEMSAGHPTVDGRVFADLRAGDVLGEIPIERAEEIPYEFAYTHDVLPDSDTGFYFVNGAAVGSTLRH